MEQAIEFTELKKSSSEFIEDKNNHNVPSPPIRKAVQFSGDTDISLFPDFSENEIAHIVTEFIIMGLKKFKSSEKKASFTELS